MNNTPNPQPQGKLETPNRAWFTQDFEWPRATITHAFETDDTLTPEDIATAAAYLA